MIMRKLRTESLDKISIKTEETDESSKSVTDSDEDDFEISSSKSSIRSLVPQRPLIGSLRTTSCCSLSNLSIPLQAFSDVPTLPKSASAVNFCCNTLSKNEHSSSASAKTEYRDNAFDRYAESALYKLGLDELRHIVASLKRDIHFVNAKLIRVVKIRGHEMYRQESKCNIITALLQAVSEKKFEHTKLQFSLHPPASNIAFHYWLNTMKALARLEDGIPGQFRANIWITLANYYIKIAKINWPLVRQTAFSNTINPDDDRLSLQILKDLHRTGWPGFGEVEKVHLKRVLLGYARYNRSIRYCQGFNVIAALLSEVTASDDEETLKVLIFLLEHVLPHGYFDQNLRGLSVDMSVMRILLREKLPQVAAHLDNLQKHSNSDYEPPLENVFSMQWFLTLFATCLPKKCVYRIIDAIMLDGSEVILKAALVIWTKLSRKILRTRSANDFYCMMDVQCKKMRRLHSREINDFIQAMYSIEDLKTISIEQLRDNVHWNIQPFTSAAQVSKQGKQKNKRTYDPEDSNYAPPISCISCRTGYFGESQITKLMKMNLSVLKKKYEEEIKIQEKAFLKFQAVNEIDTKSVYSVQLANSLSTFGDDQMQMLEWVNNERLGKGSPAFFEISRCDNSSAYVTMNSAVPVKPFAVQPKNTGESWIN